MENNKINIVIAMDSFKGSMSSMEAGSAVQAGILRAIPNAMIQIKPLADGGEGTTDALLSGLSGEKVRIMVKGPMGNSVKAQYGILSDQNTAVMEIAEAAGITLVSGEKNPFQTTTYGVGEMINDAIDKGCRNFIIGIGGSATNDGGIGMLKALGFEFLDENGFDVGEGGAALSKVNIIKIEKIRRELADCHFRIACDVKNPLCGVNGATYIFGPQKGIQNEQKEPLDRAMQNYADVTSKCFGKDDAMAEGAGAAGGLGFAFLSYLHGMLVPGSDLVCDVTGLEEAVKEVDYIITGEGRLDAQTVMGKAPACVAEIAKKYGKKVIAFAGSIASDAAVCNQYGIHAFFPIIRGVTTLDEAMNKDNAMKNLTDTAEQVFRLIR